MLRAPTVPVVLVLLLALLPPPPARSGDATVVTAHLALEPDVFGPSGAGRIPFGPHPAEGVAALPDAPDAVYARIRMADSRGLLVALAPHPESPRLWVDRNMDGALVDERPLYPHRTSSGTAATVTTEILAPYADEPDAQPVGLRLTVLPQIAADHVTLQALVHRRGTVVLGGRLRFVAITDGTFDAAFEDAERDALWLDLDGDGEIQTTGAQAERIQPGEPFRVGDEGWTARVTSRSGRAVEFQRAATVPPLPPVAWPAPLRPTAGSTPSPPDEDLADLLGRLQDERSLDYAARAATIALVGRHASADAADALLDLAERDRDAAVKAAAVRALGSAAFLDRAGRKVLEWARKERAALGAAALQALFGMGHPDRQKAYRDVLGDNDASTVGTAARHLAYEEDGDTARLLTKALEKAAVPALQYAIYAQGVRNLKDGPAAKLALQMVAVPYPLLQGVALEDLQILAPREAVEAARVLAKVRPVQRPLAEQVARVLGAVGDEATVSALLDLLDAEPLPGEVRLAVLDELRRLRGPPALAALAKALGARSPRVRRAAAVVLASIPEPSVTQALQQRAKKEKDDEVLPALLEALGDQGDPAAIPLLLQRARSRRHDATRHAALRALARLGYHQADVRKFLLGLLESREEDDRILALDAAAEARDVDLLPALLPSLGHDAWAVRLAAIGAVAALRVRAGIEPLIVRLETETTPRVREALAEALFSLTGQVFYDDATVWRRWWEAAGADFEVPAAIPRPPEEHVGGTQAGFFGLPVRSERVVFVVDQSGSMSAEMGEPGEDGKRRTRLDVAVAEVLAATSRLGGKAEVNVILFHTTIHPWKDGLQRASPGTLKSLEKDLRALRPMGGTNLYDGLALALATPGVDTVFLLSDGIPGAGTYVATPDILRAVRRENQTRRIAIHTVSLGMESELLRLLARENAGRYARR